MATLAILTTFLQPMVELILVEAQHTGRESVSAWEAAGAVPAQDSFGGDAETEGDLPRSEQAVAHASPPPSRSRCARFDRGASESADFGLWSSAEIRQALKAYLRESETRETR